MKIMNKDLTLFLVGFTFCIASLPLSLINAQGIIATNGGVVNINFDHSTPGILNGKFDATNIKANPGVGDLDSDGVDIDDDLPGAADLAAVFGSNDVKFWGATPGNVSSSADGIWAFEPTGGGNRALGIQPSSTRFGTKDYGDGQIVFKFINNSGVTLTAFRIQYDIYEANSGDRNTVIESYLTTNVSTPSYGPVRDTYTSEGNAVGIGYSWSSANGIDYSVTSGISVPDGGAIYLRFYIYDGPAYQNRFPWRDEMAIDNIKIIGANNPALLLQCSTPTAACKNATVNLNGSGNATLSASSINNGSSAVCDLAPISVSPNSFNCSNVGNNTVTLSVSDIEGNNSSCTATVTVVDNVKPVAKCKNVTVPLNTSGNGSITASAVNNGSSDACGIASLALNKTSFNCTNIGDNTVTLTVTDNNGNTKTCNATATVVDQVDPIATCQNITVSLDANGNGSTTASSVNNGSSDACGIASVVLDKTSFNCTNVGTNTVTLTVTDNNNNTKTCTATATVVDQVDPVATCQSVNVSLDANGNGSTTANAVNNGSSDACGIASLVLSKTNFNCNDIGSNTVTLTATDNNGNTKTCNATVSVSDQGDPTATCQNVTVSLDANGNGTTSANAVNNGSTDACGIASLVLDKTSFDCNDIGGNTVQLTVTDNNGNTNTCTATATVIDQVDPIATCQNVTVSLDANGNGTTSANAVNNGSNDACGISNLALSKSSFNCADVGSNTVTLTATDNNGNTKTCTATVTVEDQVNPIALCQSITLPLDANGNGYPTTNAIDNGSSDACGIANLTLNKTSFNCADLGTNSIMLTVTDNNGNTNSCTGTVNVVDQINPSPICLTTTIEIEPDGDYDIIQTDVYDNLSSFDNCSIVNVAFPATTYTCDEAGSWFTIPVTVTDVAGNQNTCNAYIQVAIGTSLASDWNTTSVGQSGMGNDFEFDPCTTTTTPENGEFTLTGGGNNAMGTSTDNVAFASQTLCGDGTITAKIESVGAYGYGGLMIRETPDAGAKQVALFSNTTASLRHETRYATNSPKQVNSFFKPSPVWLKLQRQGDWIFAYSSMDGNNFQYVHAVMVTMANCVEYGLASFTYIPNTQMDVVFSNVTVESTSGTLSGDDLTTAPTAYSPKAAVEDDLNVFPNPSQGAFTITFNQALESTEMLEIYNQQGQLVFNQQLQQGTLHLGLDIQQLPAGMYMIRVEGVSAKRLILTK